MTVQAAAMRELLGREVDVETWTGHVHGRLLSCNRRSLWLVDGEEDLMVPLDAVRSVAG